MTIRTVTSTGRAWLAALASAAIAVGAVIAIFIQQAQADPAAGTIPGPSAIVGVGGEPSQGLFDQLAADYGHRRAPLYSWDETGASPIAPKQGCTPIERPAGSSSGITALIGRQVLPGGRPCIDFARSERGRQPQDPAGLVFLPTRAMGSAGPPTP
jgi:hypothetical protein